MNAILGGALIGLAAALLLLSAGRILGVSGIVGNLITSAPFSEKKWRLFFILGILSGGLILRVMRPESFQILTNARYYDYIIGGLLVGFGTAMGSGCTSGHGVCGISRLSRRSVVSTIVFILFGIIGVVIAKSIRGGLV